MGSVLVVDDDKGSQMLARYIIEGLGFEVSIATDGAQALEIVEKHGLQVALVDVRLPDMSGFELIKQLRARGVRLLCWSANPNDRRTALLVGAHAYLEKPIDVAGFEAAVCALATNASVSRNPDESLARDV